VRRRRAEMGKVKKKEWHKKGVDAAQYVESGWKWKGGDDDEQEERKKERKREI